MGHENCAISFLLLEKFVDDTNYSKPFPVLYSNLFPLHTPDRRNSQAIEPSEYRFGKLLL